jgi:hypothetical protein
VSLLSLDERDRLIQPESGGRPYHDRAQRRRSRTPDRHEPLGGQSTVLVNTAAGFGALGRSAGSTRVCRWVCTKPSENRPTNQFCCSMVS